MSYLVVQACKYFMIILFLIYSFACFHVFRYKEGDRAAKRTYGMQRIVIYLMHFSGFLALYLSGEDVRMIGLYCLQVLILSIIFTSYHLFYKHASELVLNNMAMLLSVGFIILTRLSVEKAFRQYLFVCAGFFLSLFIPLTLSRISIFRKLSWIYAIVGIGALGVVAVMGVASYGAKLSITIGPISIQPSEFVKILFVMFLSGMLYQKSNGRQVLLTGIIASFFVLLLIASRDLGGALLYYIAFLVIVYVATKKLYYFFLGIGALVAGAVSIYPFFSHVQTRVLAWRDPLSVIDNQGYQICQSLFGIGTGGWFGLGLKQGLPQKIPVVDKDFIFSAIAEEMGGIFAICLIIVCLSCFFMIINISMKMKDSYYKLTAVGLGTLYATQVFLTIGGAIKFIPSTGVTLPFVSYGGSSMLSTMILFGIIQGLYIMNYDEGKQKNEK